MLIQNKDGHGTLWRLDEDSQIHAIDPHDIPKESRPPILFIHGVEYADHHEVIADLVGPMLQIIGKERLVDRSVYFFTWNSLILTDEKIGRKMGPTLLSKANFAFHRLPKCRFYLLDVERRAREAAHYLLPFAESWNKHCTSGPTVITHSMGSLVWAETIKALLVNESDCSKPGIWWSLQPAMSRWSFSQGGEYEAIPKIYRGHEFAKAMIWYSRLDFVLSSIYMMAKRGGALGQWGCPSKSLPQRDITKWAKEAHGCQHLSNQLGPFFTRVKAILRDEAMALGL